MVHTCSPGTQKVAAEFEVNMGCRMRHYQKTQRLAGWLSR